MLDEKAFFAAINQVAMQDLQTYGMAVKYFYKYQPLRPLEEIKVEILALESETEGLLKEILE